MVNKQSLTQEKGAIEGEVFFNDSSQLDFNEVVNTNQKSKQKYSYHYMDKNKELIFRYDNVQHHREIKTFPHHKHTENGIIESSEPNLEKILTEIEQKILKD
ncbi:MAG: hypothetical protein HY738_21925 [Bacteroidia bacterium]|nr:hypothetical protein [Bacteroidia bacterium]